jgi:N-acyl-D-amino-acid deacylase
MSEYRCHLIFEGATVVDGTGAPAYVADVAVEGERIAAVGDLSTWAADERVGAAGRVLAPGFIDVHTHDDLAALDRPDMLPKTSQGVTTVVAGNCGVSLAPFRSDSLPAPLTLLGPLSAFAYPTVADYRAAWDRGPSAVNLALLVGHSSLRVSVMGDDLARPATETEITSMVESLRLALRQGAIGLSTGLAYPPAKAAPAAEVVALATVLAEEGDRIYTSHMRDEGDLVAQAVTETLDTAAASGVRAVISHFKCCGVENYGRAAEVLGLVDSARAAGRAVGFDVYPYTASSTSLLPDFVKEAEDVLIADCPSHPEMVGRMLNDIAAEWEVSREAAAERLVPAGAIYFQMDEDDLRRIMSHPAAMIGSDGLPGMPNPHPRLWGTFPRVLGRYARDLGLLRLETAVHKMTGLSASTFGLSDRGRIAEGMIADLVLFDPETVIDVADYRDPERASTGIERVFVGGTPVFTGGAETGARPGRFLPA